MQRPPPPEAETQDRRYRRRSTDRPDLARIFTAPFAAHVASLILGPEVETGAKRYPAPKPVQKGKLVDKKA